MHLTGTSLIYDTGMGMLALLPPEVAPSLETWHKSPEVGLKLYPQQMARRRQTLSLPSGPPHQVPASHSPSTQEGWARVVPATWPARQEHLTVWDRSSTRFRLQQR